MPSDRVLAIRSCRIQVALDPRKWLGGFSTAHPTIRLEVVDRLEIGDGVTMFEVRLVGDDGSGWEREIRSRPGVEEVEVLAAADGEEVLRVFFRGRTFIPMLRSLRLVRHFPFPVQNGVATWTVVGSSEKVQELLRRLKTDAKGFRVDSIRHGDSRGGHSVLTPRQKDLLERALAEGYFDVPRRISLTKLAPKIGVASSTLSVSLAVIEKKLLEPHSRRSAR